MLHKTILLENLGEDSFKLSLFEKDKLIDSIIYDSSRYPDYMDRLQFMFADLLSVVAPQMRDTDEEVIYIVKSHGVDYVGKKKKYVFSGSTKH